MFIIPLFITIIASESLVSCALRPNSAICGVLQTPRPEKDTLKLQIAGVYLPGVGVKWHVRRKNAIFDPLLRQFERFRPTFKDDSCKDFLYRVVIVNTLNSLKYAAKKRLVTLSVKDGALVATRNGFFKRLLKNVY